MNDNYFITVFTATFNRSDLLVRLHESLALQTNKQFEWLIVDDGSTDNTTDVIQKLQDKTSIFSIRYFKQSNQGKHVAINKGIKEARGDYFFIVDSDDRLPKNSLSIIDKKVKKIDLNPNVAGVVGLKCFFDGSVVGSNNLKNDMVCTLFDYRYYHRFIGDRAEVIKTNIFKKYLFPQFKNENFVPESIVWNEIAKTYKLLFFPENVYECEYLEEGLSAKSVLLRRKNPIGTAHLYSELHRIKAVPLSFRIKANINFWRFFWMLPQKKKYLRLLKISWYLVPSFIIGSLLSIKDAISIKKKQ